MKKKLLFIIASFILSFQVSAQFQVSTAFNANSLVSKLVGDGVVYTNATLTCANNGKGFFTNGITTTVGMDSGIVLTSGRAIQVVNNPTFFANTINNFNPGDADLQTNATGSLYDICKLEFDFVPVGDTVRFNYRFGSEEYPAYTCTNFNDIFAFYISGPGYATPTNVAKIPGTNCPVSINTVNGSTNNPCGNVSSPCAPPNNALFINAAGITGVAYSGMTQKLSAIAPVTPCSTYHMKFAIADVADEQYDSGVFLEANSFSSEAVTVSNVVSTNNTGGINPFSIEGCNAAVVTLSRPVAKPFPQLVTISTTGSATSGIDYTPLPSTITIPANTTSTTISIASLTDAILEGTETVKIYIYGALCSTLTITDSVTIDILEYPTYTVSNNDSICQGDMVNVSANVSPPNSALSFTWSNSISGLMGNATNYNVTPNVTTTYTLSGLYPGCPPKISNILIQVEPPPSLALNATNVSCFGLSNGQITATGTGLFNPLQFSLSPTSNVLLGSPAVFTNLAQGNYIVTVTSAIGCTNQSNISITQPNPIGWASVTPVNLICLQPTSGSISVNANGGTSPYSYSISPNIGAASGGNFSNLGLGNYTITASDSKGCSITTVVNLSQPVGPAFVFANADSVLCNGGNTGSIQTFANNILGVVTYQLLPTSATNTSGIFNNLAAGIYTIVAADASICTSSQTVTVEQPTPMAWSNAQSTNITCQGLQNGSINVLASGGVPNYNYQLLPNNTNNSNGTFTNLTPIAYTVNATDANGCTLSNSFILTQPSLLQITNIQTTTTSCIPANDGTLTINAAGGTLPYSYSVNGLVSNNNLYTNLSAGNYTIIVTDSKNCTASTIQQISLPTLPSISNILTTTASCVPGCDATATVTVTAGSSNLFSYSSDGINFQTSATLTSLCATNYTITVKDGNNCTATSNVSINALNAPSLISSSFSNITCNGLQNGNIQMLAAGGTGSISYFLLPNGNVSGTGIFSNLAAASYTVVAKDANNCSVSGIFSISEPTLLKIDSANKINLACFNVNNGSVQIFASGGTGLNYSYAISPAGTFQAPNNYINLSANINYTITVSDANNCSTNTIVNLSQPNQLLITSSISNNITCNNLNNGSIQINAIGGTGTKNFTLQPLNINNTTGTFNSLSAGNYTIIVSDANNCTTSTLVNIVNPSAVTLVSFVSNNITCNNLNNGNVTLIASGGTGSISYNLQPNNLTNITGIFNNLNVNTYTITASDANGCSISTAFNISNPSALVITNFASTNLLCATNLTGLIQTIANGGIGTLNYTLQPNNTTNTSGQFSNLNAGTYTVIVTDANNCSLTSVTTISAPPILSLTFVSSQNVTCSGLGNGSIISNATGGSGNYNYTLLPSNLSNSNGNFSNILANTYSIIVTDSNGCIDSLNGINIIDPSFLSIINFNQSSVSCYGYTDGQISMGINGGTPPITYTISPLTGNQTGGQFSNLIAGTYTVTGTDANGCFLTSVTTITQNSSFTIANLNNISPTCYNSSNGQLSIVPNGGLAPYTFLINNASPNNNGIFSNLGGGTYMISAIDAVGCRIDSNVTIVSPLPIVISNLTLTPILCANAPIGSINIDAVGGVGLITYTLKPLDVSNTSGDFINLQNGIYTITIIDAAGCKKDTVINLIPPSPFIAKIITIAPTCLGIGNDASAEAFVQGGTPPFTYLWNTNPIKTTAKIDSLTSGFYAVKIEDQNGCKVSDSVLIEGSNCCENVFIPSAFSPNNDAKNDVFKLASSVNMIIKQFELYNRWGNVVWSTRDKNGTWNGKIESVEAEAGTYFYVLRYKCESDQKDYLKKGDLILIR